MSETLHEYEFKHCFGKVVKATIDDIAEAGWPICPDCGDDMARISRPYEELVVHVTLEGGVVQKITHPDGIKVMLRDYDTDGVSEDMLQTDENGDRFLESTW